jgi:hypothetical protein
MATQDNIKKRYKKPKVTEVKLEIGEAVLAACKQNASDPEGKGVKDCSHTGCKTYMSIS